MRKGIDATTPDAVNLAWVAAILMANLMLFAGLPVLAGAGWGWWLLLPLLVLTSVPHWGLIHEAIHGHLHRDATVNGLLGRLLAIAFLSPFETLRFGHLSHHALNARPVERPECYDPERTPRWLAALVYYPRLLFGLYAAELASGPLSLLPRRLLRPIVRRVFYEGADDAAAAAMAHRAERQLLASAALRRARGQALCIILLMVAGFWLYAASWPLLAIAIAGRGFIISFLDNAPHYGGALAEPSQGYDMAAPRLVRLAVLNSNYHGVHHTHPNLPWSSLPAAFTAERRRYSGLYLATPWRQLQGPRPIGPIGAGEGRQARATAN